MSNFLYIPYSNSVRFYELSPVELPQYLSRDFYDYPHLTQNADKPWLNQVIYKQKWQTSDTTYLQFESNFAPIQVQMINCQGDVLLTQNATQKRVNKYMPGYYVYEIALSWASFNSGTYFIKIIPSGGSKVQISEPQLIAETHKNTKLIEYRNSRYHGDVIYETGIRFGFRVEATFGFLNPGSENVLYEDQKLNPTVLSSRSFRSFPLNIGGSKGCPDWVFDLINIIFTCNDVTIDGKSYAKTEDGKFEFKTEDRYPLRGAIMQIREGINRGSRIVSVDVDTNKRLTVLYQIDGTIYGDLSVQAGSNLVPIISSE